MIVIVLYHAGLYMPGGFVSLDAFFVISGFVITSMILRGRARTGTFSLKEFYLRRFKRLTPALLATVIAVLLLCIVLVSPITVQDNAALTGVGAVFFVANGVVQATSGDYFGAAIELNPLMHIWSLSLEEQFYLVFPLILVVGWWAGRRADSRMPLVLACLAFAVSLWFGLFGVSALPQINPVIFGYFSPVGRAWEFFAGALLAFAAQRPISLSRRTATSVGGFGLALLIAPMWLIDSSVQYPGPWTLVPVTATVLLIIAGFQPENLVSRGLSSRFMVFTGDRSYSWYLWHWPVIVFAFAAFPWIPGIGFVAAVASIGPALLNYRFVEQWSRYATWNPRTVLMRIGSMAVAALAVASFVLVGASNGWWNQNIQVAQAQLLEDHAAKANGCHLYSPIPAEAYDACWLEQGEGTPLAMFGDSNADHLSDALVAAGRSLGRPVNVVSASSCPFIVGDPSVDDRCQAYIDATMEWLGQQPQTTVVLSTSGSSYDVDNGGLLANTVTAIEDLGHDVVLIKPIPFMYDAHLQHGVWDPMACPAATVALGACAGEISVEQARTKQGSVWDGLARAAEQTGAPVVDVSAELCPQGVCRTNVDGRWAYQDFNHLTANESRRLGPVLENILSARA